MKPKYRIGQLVIYPTYTDYDYGRITKIIIEDKGIKYEIDKTQKETFYEESELTTNPCDWIDSLCIKAEVQIKSIIQGRDEQIAEIRRVFKLK